MVKQAFLVLLTSTLVAGFLACPGPPQQAEKAKPEEEMTEEQKMEYVFANCVCAKCPSWTTECTEKGVKGGFCAVGKTDCITKESGCICPECPVATKLGLKWGYYCTRGSAKEMMEKEAAGKQPGS